MEKETKRSWWIMLCALVAFVVWTIVVMKVDVQAVGPKGSVVGMAAFNQWFHELTGVNTWLYDATDVLGLVPFIVAFGFAMLGLVQLIKRRSLFKVDKDILVLGGFYAIVIVTFIFFEILKINYRPVLIEGKLEASYPSSTTLIVLCVMPTLIMQLNSRMADSTLRKILNIVIVAFTVFMTVGRVISGVHWITDIIGGVLLSVALVCFYKTLAGVFKDREVKRAE